MKYKIDIDRDLSYQINRSLYSKLEDKLLV